MFVPLIPANKGNLLTYLLENTTTTYTYYFIQADGKLCL